MRIKSAAVVSLVSEKENEMSVTQRPARCATELRRSLGRLWLHIELPLPSFLPSFITGRAGPRSLKRLRDKSPATSLTHGGGRCGQIQQAFLSILTYSPLRFGPAGQ